MICYATLVGIEEAGTTSLLGRQLLGMLPAGCILILLRSCSGLTVTSGGVRRTLFLPPDVSIECRHVTCQDT